MNTEINRINLQSKNQPEYFIYTLMEPMNLKREDEPESEMSQDQFGY